MVHDARPVRARNATLLGERGFRFAQWLPMRGPEEQAVRARAEIVRRLAALEALCVYVTAPPKRYPEGPLRKMIRAHDLAALMTADELEILGLERSAAHAAHADTIGWKMENMVPLAWALGHTVEPCVDGAMIAGQDLSSILFEFAPREAAACAAAIAAEILRPAGDILAMEDLFYCAHNAVRSAQFSDAVCVPRGFDPVAHGGVIHERRHALTWMVSPGVDWDATDLST